MCLPSEQVMVSMTALWDYWLGSWSSSAHGAVCFHRPLMPLQFYDVLWHRAPRKFQTWSDNHGGRPEDSGLTMDEILRLGTSSRGCRLGWDIIGCQLTDRLVASFCCWGYSILFESECA